MIFADFANIPDILDIPDNPDISDIPDISVIADIPDIPHTNLIFIKILFLRHLSGKIIKKTHFFGK